MKSTKEKLNKLVKMRDISLLAVDFILKVSGPDPKNPDLHIMLKNTIRDTFKLNDLKGLTMIARDMNEWARMLPAKEYALYEQEKDKAIKYDLSMFTDSKISSLLSQGKIQTYSEYCLATDYIEQHDLYSEKFEEIKRMILEYESM